MQSLRKLIDEPIDYDFKSTKTQIKYGKDTVMVKITRQILTATIEIANARTRVVLTTTCSNNPESIKSCVKRNLKGTINGRGKMHPIAIRNRESNNKRTPRRRRR